MFSARKPGFTRAALVLTMSCLAGSIGCSMNQTCKTDCEKPCEPVCKPKPCKVCSAECCNPQGKIRKLRAVNVPCTTDLLVGYKVETMQTCDEYDLLVRIEHCDQVIFERLINLGKAYKTDANGNRHFRGSITGKLPNIICGDRKTLIASGCLIPHSASGDPAAGIDHEREHVDGSNDTLLWGSRVPLGWPPAKSQ